MKSMIALLSSVALAAMVGSSFAAPKEKAGEITLVSAPLRENFFECNLTNVSGGTLVDVEFDILDTSGVSVADATETILDGGVGSVTHEPSRNMRYCEISYFGLPGVVRATFCFSDDLNPVSGCVPVE